VGLKDTKAGQTLKNTKTGASTMPGLTTAKETGATQEQGMTTISQDLSTTLIRVSTYGAMSATK
jgi:hypothetical protein